MSESEKNVAIDIFVNNYRWEEYLDVSENVSWQNKLYLKLWNQLLSIIHLYN